MARGKRGMEFGKEELNSQLESNDNHLLTKNTMIEYNDYQHPIIWKRRKGVETTFLFAKWTCLGQTSYFFGSVFFSFFLKENIKRTAKV